MRRFSTTPDQVRASGRAWVESIEEDPSLARELIRRTRYWVEDDLSDDFYPSKWVGFADMTAARYHTARRAPRDGAWFNGTAARRAVERSIETPFVLSTVDSPVADRLRLWTTARLSGVLDGISSTKWAFVRLPAPPEPSWVVANPTTGSGPGDKDFWGCFAESWKYYEATWSTYNQVLYDMCAAMPSHSSLQDVVAKVGIVARAYAAGLERHGDPEGPGAIVGVSQVLYEASGDVDRLLAELAEVAGDGKVLNADRLAEVTRIHGTFQELVGEATRSTVRSWVSKYLHFHAPGVPLYDSRACSVLGGRYDRRKARNRHFDRPAAADHQYWAFCNRFLSMWEEARSLGPRRSVRRLDQHLLYLSDLWRS
jgi:hypothetical protein